MPNDNIIGVCLPLPSKETFSKLPSDGKLDILFDMLVILATNELSIHNELAATRIELLAKINATKTVNTAFSAISGVVGGFLAALGFKLGKF